MDFFELDIGGDYIQGEVHRMVLNKRAKKSRK